MNESKLDEMKMAERIKELHLLLIYLTGWQENSRKIKGKKVFKAWKGYLHEVLDELEARRLIRVHYSAGHILLTDKGIRIARALKDRYLTHCAQ